MGGVLYPVITMVPQAIRCLKRKEKVGALSEFARKSAQASAVWSELCIDEFKKDDQGVPMPLGGTFWSVTHKEDRVAGVVSRQSVGIDIEIIKPVSEALFKKIIKPYEYAHFKNQAREIVFFRGFTAKEAVLKKTTIGIKGLSKVKIDAVLDEKNLIIDFHNKKYCVENFYCEDYLAAVTKDQCDVQWVLE